MNNQHPIVPPCKLIEKWHAEYLSENKWKDVITQAAQWGADQELKACCGWLSNRSSLTEVLRIKRRPKPPSLKEQALKALKVSPTLAGQVTLDITDLNTILRALEALPNE